MIMFTLFLSKTVLSAKDIENNSLYVLASSNAMSPTAFAF